MGVDLYRAIDRLTKAKTVFAKSGIPGSVGNAACDLWPGLGARLTEGRTFRVWPFEGDLEFLLRSAPVVVGEIYPRAAYATALLDLPAARRPPLAVAKTDPPVRSNAVKALQSAEWVRTLGVSIRDAQHAEAGEDDFDSCLTAAALLRSVLEGDPLCPAILNHAYAEGGILGTPAVGLRMRERKFPVDANPQHRIWIRPKRIAISGAAQPVAVRKRAAKNSQSPRGEWNGHACLL